MISNNHPRAESLKIRDKIVKGIKLGITSQHGLLAHGRGEAFDYLVSEKTNDFARTAIKTTSTTLLLANHPVISVNGNTAALCVNEIIELSKIINCPIEVNIFHYTLKREKAIAQYLKLHGAKRVVGIGNDASIKISNISSKRCMVSPKGIYTADVVFVPLEDGDRCKALVSAGKKVITIDLNPLSRTAQIANITIVDNIVRALPLILKQVKKFKREKKDKLEEITRQYDNKQILKETLKTINKRLLLLSTSQMNKNL